MKSPVMLEQQSPVVKDQDDQQSSARLRASDIGVGSEIDSRYTLVRELGRGAAGIVFEAHHRFTQRRVALKLVVPEAPTTILGELRARLLREARALAAVRHPGIVDVLDGGVAQNGIPYIVLELLEGARSLEGVLTTRTKISHPEAVAMAVQLCSALTAVHKAGVVHRDLKPGNIFIHRDQLGRERVRLVDFGIARVYGRDEQRLTRTGALLGTPEYMSPEQLLGMEDVDHLADVYALGVTLYECLSGRLPYEGTYQQILLHVSAGKPLAPLASLCSAPKELCEVIERAISRNPMHRQRSMAEFAADLLAATPQAPETTSFFEPARPPSVSPKGMERRQAVRAPYASPVQIVAATGTVDGRSEDISETGMLFISRQNCAPTGRVTVRFALPIEGRLVSCGAEVRWVRDARKGVNGPRAVGLELVDLPEGARAEIATYVSLMSNERPAGSS